MSTVTARRKKHRPCRLSELWRCQQLVKASSATAQIEVTTGKGLSVPSGATRVGFPHYRVLPGQEIHIEI